MALKLIQSGWFIVTFEVNVKLSWKIALHVGGVPSAHLKATMKQGIHVPNGSL
jgi:acid phosphatase family membrane protein YuiD